MKSQLSDTTPEAERVMIEAIRRLPVWKRLAGGTALHESCRRLAIADIRSTDPEIDELELRRRLAARHLPPDVVVRVYGAADTTAAA